MKELTITYKIECTEIIKDPDTIDAILADGPENVSAAWEDDVKEIIGVDDLHVQNLKLFLMEDAQ